MITTRTHAFLASLYFFAVHETVDGGHGRLALEDKTFNKPKYYNNFTTLASERGYKAEEHTLVTKDGYILTVFRIQKGKNCRGLVKKRPVLLMHGLLMNSDVWLDAGPSAGLAYLIADACYDLWVGNVRGNYYGRRHVYLDPDSDADFWKFSTDEMSKLDLPATIDYMLNYTKSSDLMYVGFSQGSRIFLTMCTETSGYCDKARVSILMAPAVRAKNTRSLPVLSLVLTYAALAPILKTPATMEALPKDGPLEVILSKICRSKIFSGNVCKSFLSFIDSYDPDSVLAETEKVLYDHFPGGTSAYTLAIYGQNTISLRFQKFDYGRSKNLEMYGEVQPPLYNLTRVSAPTVLIYGNNDYLVGPQDVIWLSNQLPNVLETYEVKRSTWNHFDNCYSKYTKMLVFPKINQYLETYS